MDTLIDLILVPTAKLLELFVDVEFIGIGSKTRLSEDDAQWLHFGNMAYGFDVYFLVEASHEGSLINNM